MHDPTESNPTPLECEPMALSAMTIECERFIYSFISSDFYPIFDFVTGVLPNPCLWLDMIYTDMLCTYDEISQSQL